MYGEPKIFTSPSQAFQAGISTVHQERNLITTFNVAENVMFQGMTEKTFSKVRMKTLAEKAKKYLDMVRLDVDPYQPVKDMSSAQMQLLEIARALALDAKIVLLDEPTASISVEDSKMLMKIVRRLSEQGYSFIYVSHKLDEIFEICDSICVIKDGKNAGDVNAKTDICPTKDMTREELIKRMVGRKQRTTVFPVRDTGKFPVVLKAENIMSEKNPHMNSFELRQGEILGWYGLVSSGRTELAREIMGLDPVTAGTIWINGDIVRIRSVARAIKRYNIAYASETRNEEGLFLIHDIRTNISSSVWDKEATAGFVNAKKEVLTASDYIKKLEIKTPSMKQLIGNLSGGNRQKVSLAKVLATKPKILIIDEPTVGIDIKTKEDIHNIIWNLAQEGISIILISSDMPELISLADRVLVFSEGRICDELFGEKEYNVMSTKIMTSIVKNTTSKIS